MKILQGKNIKMPVPCVLAMGKFESIHLGHQALINEMKRLADEQNLATALIVFEPHPYQVLVDPSYKPLFTREEREYLVAGIGVDYLLEYPFDANFAALSPEDFCHKLCNDLQARVIVVGSDYRFGHERSGTVDTLRRTNAQVFEVTHVGGSNKTSTSTIRSFLAENNLTQAANLLGYPFFIMGKVTPGRKLGRTIGFPTINIYPASDKFLPADGVYATQTCFDGATYKGITNIGVRPTVEGTDAPRSVETFLLDYPGGDLYGNDIRTEFLQFIRPEQRFESIEALKMQIQRDCKIVHRR